MLKLKNNKIRREIALALCAMPITVIFTPQILRADPAATRPAELSKDQLDAMIQQAGTTQPEWWDSTPMTVPDGMDLTWSNKAADPQNAIRVYLLNTIFPNADRWREGVKLVQHSINVNKDNPTAKANATIFLSNIYTEMLQDYPRGAFWAKKLGPQMNVRIAQCYLKMGGKQAAIDLLSKVNLANNKDPQLIKAWTEVGDLDKALQAADGLAKVNPAGANFAAGEACRLAGKIPEAVAFYQKVIAQNTTNGETMYVPRAKASLEAIKLYDSLDLKKIPDGTYASECLGYSGEVKVQVIVKDHKIASVKVIDHHEKRFYSSIIDTSAQIIARQSVKGIDTTSGATITSEAIINASAKALSAAQK